MKSIVMEFPAEGILSMDSIERYAADSNTSTDKWMSEAIAWYIDFHESQYLTPPQPTPAAPPKLPILTKIKLRIAERLQDAADRLLDGEE